MPVLGIVVLRGERMGKMRAAGGLQYTIRDPKSAIGNPFMI
jgi:hypothetical protein